MAKGIYVGVSDIKLICPRSACRSTRITRIHTNPDKYQCGDCLFEGTLEQFKQGNENTARRVRKSYFGVGGKARKIRRGYIGVGGVARPFWSGEKELVSYGPITAMSTVRCGHAGGTVGNYALFAGGQDANTYVSTVDTYNTALTRGSAPNLNAAVWSHAAASVGDYVIFAGGENGYYQSTATAYNRSLTRSSPASLSSTKTGLTSASVGSYALFAGGSRGSGPLKTVDAYNTSLTRTTVADLSVERQYAAGAGINGYALFSGGRDAGYDAVNSVDAYNTSLTRSTAASLSEKKTTIREPRSMAAQCSQEESPPAA